MSGFRVMAAFAAGATIAGMAVGVARLTDVVEPATAVADVETGEPFGTPTPTPTPTAVGSPETAHPERSAAEGGAESRDAAAAAERRRGASTATPTEPQQKAPEGWHAPKGAPEEVTAGVLARVASRRAKATGCEPAREIAAVERKAPTEPRRRENAEPCPPEDGIESIEIDWSHGPTPTR